MFNWIKNLSKGTNPASAEPIRLTRVVKHIVPTSIKQAEDEEEKRQLAKAEAAAAAERADAPTITLTQSIPKPPISVAMPSIAMEPESVSAPRPAIRLSTPVAEDEEPEAAPMVRLTTAKKRPTLNFNSPAGLPAPEANREIVLTVGDFVSRIPTNFLNENALPATQEVRFDAADLYSDMSKGRATVPLSIIAEVLPALFKRSLSPEEDIEIQLPLPKIVAQMSDLFTRPDQEAPEVFEEVETPFLKAAQRDQEIHKVSGAVAAPQPTPPQPAPAPVPAAVPAESASRPKPIGLRLDSAPAAAVPPVSLASQDSGRRVTIRVRPLIQAMPGQRASLLGSISENSEVDLPLEEIESQLSSGKVSISLDTFSAGLKPEDRAAFKENYTGENVLISLPEIVKNLPDQSFKRRADQHQQEVDENEFETPFNRPADAAPVPVAPAPLPIATPAPAPTPAPAAVAPAPTGPLRAKPLITPAIANYTTRKLNSTGNKFPSPMHAALGTQDALDAKKVVKLASALPGVASLTIITEDGLGLAGNLPTFMDPDGFSAMAPQLHRKMATHASEMKLGELKHLSLTTETHTVTIFTGRGMTIAVLHQNQSDLGHGVREKFIAIVDGLAKQYNPELAAN